MPVSIGDEFPYEVVLLGPGDAAVSPGYTEPGYYVLQGEEIVEGPYKTQSAAERAAGY